MVTQTPKEPPTYVACTTLAAAGKWMQDATVIVNNSRLNGLFPELLFQSLTRSRTTSRAVRTVSGRWMDVRLQCSKDNLHWRVVVRFQ